MDPDPIETGDEVITMDFDTMDALAQLPADEAPGAALECSWTCWYTGVTAN